MKAILSNKNIFSKKEWPDCIDNPAIFYQNYVRSLKRAAKDIAFMKDFY